MWSFPFVLDHLGLLYSHRDAGLSIPPLFSPIFQGPGIDQLSYQVRAGSRDMGSVLLPTPGCVAAAFLVVSLNDCDLEFEGKRQNS